MARADLAKAKQARQKKIAIGGGVLLAVVLVIQVPRTMKMMSGTAVDSAPVAAAPAAGTSAPAPVATPAPAAAAAAPASDEAKLVSFDRFKSKDPFAAQIRAQTASAAAGAAAPSPSAPSPSAPPAPAAPTERSQTVAASFSAGTPKTETRSLAQTATIAVNGTEHTVARSKSFPESDPVFRVVSIADDSVEIAIVGGSLKDGGKTITVTTAKPVTLMNTADGKRYELRLVATSG